MSEIVEIISLIPDPSNARKHNKKNIEAIKGSLARFGQQKPIVISKDNIVIAGNGTLQAAKELGWSQIEIKRSKLSGSDITAFAIADNRSSELGEWDDEVLMQSLKSLDDEKYDLSDIGFDEKDLARIFDEDEPNVKEEKYKSIFEVVVECADETEQSEVYKRISDMGFKCRVLSM